MLSMLGMLQEVGVADPEMARQNLAILGKTIGASIAVLGAGLGIGRIGASMTESMARQPEIAASIQTASIILAALIEGAAFFGLVITLIS